MNQPTQPKKQEEQDRHPQPIRLYDGTLIDPFEEFIASIPEDPARRVKVPVPEKREQHKPKPLLQECTVALDLTDTHHQKLRRLQHRIVMLELARKREHQRIVMLELARKREHQRVQEYTVVQHLPTTPPPKQFGTKETVACLIGAAIYLFLRVSWASRTIR